MTQGKIIQRERRMAGSKPNRLENFKVKINEKEKPI